MAFETTSSIQHDRGRAWVVSTSTLLLGMCIIGAIRDPAGLPLFIRALAPIAGILFFLGRWRFDPIFAPPFMIVTLGMLSMVDHGLEALKVAKYMQVFGMVLMAQFVGLQNPALIPRLITLLLGPVALVAIPLEILIGDPGLSRELFGVEMPRFLGLAGLHTQSAFLYMFIAIILIYDRRWLLALFFVAATLSTGSRGFAAAAAIALIIALTPGRRLKTALTFIVVLTAVASPLWVGILEATLSDQQKFALNVVTTRRFDHWATYLNMGLANPFFGVGFMEGTEYYDRFHAATFRNWIDIADGHNLILSLWGEWGVVCWAIFSGWLLSLVFWAGRRAPRFLPILGYITTIYTFHDGITDWVFWFGIGFLIACSRHAGTPASARPVR